MPLPRLIPCLDVAGGRVVKGVRFQGLRDVGDPIALGERYSELGADELVFLDVAATIEERETLVELVRRIADRIAIPFTVGGGIRSAEDGARLVAAGADKISVNSAALGRPDLIGELAERLGSQAVVVAIDATRGDVRSHAGSRDTGRRAVVDGADAAADGERDRDPVGDPAYELDQRLALLDRRRDVEEDELVGAEVGVALAQLHGIADVAQALEANALDDAPAGDVEARDQARERHRSR